SFHMAIFIKVETAVTRPTKICLFVTKSLKSEVSVCVFHGHFPIFRELDVQDISVEYPRILSAPKYIFVRKSGFFGYELKLLISTAGGRFPRAWLEPPCASHYGVSRLMGLHCRSSHRRTFAIPANVFGGSSNRRPRSRRLPFQSTVQCVRL